MIKAKTFLAIAQRELWEHPNLIWRIPLGLGLLFVFLAVCSVVFGFNYLGDINAEVTVDVVGGSDLMTVWVRCIKNVKIEAFFFGSRYRSPI